MSTEMKKLIIGGTEYEIVDDAGRARITALEQGGGSGTGLTQAEKNLLLTLFEKAAYAESDASTAYTALSNLWTGYSITWSGTGYTKSNSAVAVSAGSSFTSTITANTGFTITNVVATMGGNTVQGAWSNGTVTIPNVTGDIVITVTTAQITVSSISAVYTQSDTVYDTDSLDSLKSDLVVTATFTDSTTGVIAAEDYTLSGTLSAGTSTITVTYAGLTDTFNVTVTEDRTGWHYDINDLTKVTGSLGNKTTATCGMALFRKVVNGRSFVLGTGDTSVALLNTDNGNIASQTSPYYPIKIPEGATAVNIAIIPSTQYVQILSRVLNGGVYSAFSTTSGWSGYQQGGGTKTFESAPDNAYIFVSTRYNADGTEYPVEPTALDITFS